MVIPAEITLKHGVVQEEVFRQGPQARGIEDAVFEFATVAHDHLKTARSMLLNVEGSNGSKRGFASFLGGVCVINRDPRGPLTLKFGVPFILGTGVKLSQTSRKSRVQCV
jgi:hypothetical protein